MGWDACWGYYIILQMQIYLFIYVKRKQSTSAPGTTKNTDFTVRRLSLQQQETLDIVRTTQS